MSGERLNLLLVMADQHRADWLVSDAELPLRTPNLGALADRGASFVQAYCASPLCGPSRACLASGMDYPRCGVPNHLYDYPLDLPTYYRQLRNAGYQVFGVGKFDLHKSTMNWGLDGSRLLDEWGFSGGIDNEGKRDAIFSGAQRPAGPYMAYLHSRGLAEQHVEDFRRRKTYGDTFPTPLPDDAYCDNWIAENALRLLEESPSGRPWHLVVNFAGPHEPMDVTSGMKERWKDVQFPLPIGSAKGHWDHQEIRRNYAAMIENLDRHLGRLMEAVEARGETERTLIVYASDHGELLGDHGLWEKSTPHQASIRVPLLVAGPSVLPRRVAETPVQLHDLAATFLEAGGAEPLPGSDTRSLWPLLTGSSAVHRRAAVSALGGWRAVTDGRFKLVERLGQPPRLVDLQDDPSEATDVFDLHPAVAAELRSVVEPGPTV